MENGLMEAFPWMSISMHYIVLKASYTTIKRLVLITVRYDFQLSMHYISTQPEHCSLHLYSNYFILLVRLLSKYMSGLVYKQKLMWKSCQDWWVTLPFKLNCQHFIVLVSAQLFNISVPVAKWNILMKETSHFIPIHRLANPSFNVMMC